MRLYHGSNTKFDDVDFSKCRPYKDFGKGFYTTEIREQAKKMAKRVSRIYGGRPYVAEYELDESVFNDEKIKVKIFEKPTKEWALFVINNRSRDFRPEIDNNNNVDNKYDLVVGPVANDDLALLFRQFSGGLIDVDVLVREMKFKQLTNQYSFHTERALKYLIKAGEING